MTTKKETTKKEFKKPEIKTLTKEEQSKIYNKEALSLANDENKALHRENQDLLVERDALAARVLELEKRYPIRLHDTEAHQRIEKFEAFIRESLKTATWNSTVASELIK